MKARILIPFLMLTLSAALFTGCEELYMFEPHCIIEDVVEVDGNGETLATTLVSVRNNGGETAYDVTVEVNLFFNGYIIDRGFVVIPELLPGESEVDDAVFTEIQRHGDYDFGEYILFWYDYDGNYFEEVYEF